MTEHRFCSFTVGGLLFGIDVARVQEVLGTQPVTPVPLAQPSVVGLINLRGQVVTAVDARRRLGDVEPELAQHAAEDQLHGPRVVDHQCLHNALQSQVPSMDNSSSGSTTSSRLRPVLKAPTV
jgi:hypothetical protein